MTEPSISREQSLFEAARELREPAQRCAFLREACGEDSALRIRIEKLLKASEQADKFFAGCAPALQRVSDTRQSTETRSTNLASRTIPVAEEKLSSKIGPYKLLQKIGEGGCGVVYMAEQEKAVRRRVALKIIKLGMDTKSVIARFEAERQALAMMDHPNIARVLDAGATETGRPYFVMELVYGVKITEYCDQNRLGTDQRLDLFIRICHAIQHAHQKGIIHRDIKPSNILVTMHDGIPVPKVIDFGIAKATEERLTDKTLFTAYAQFIGTPAYMSPEQVELSGLDVDTRSDIYSLGVLLYELLTGRTPFDAKELLKSGVDEMRRTLREREPYSPSARLHTLAGDELTKTAIQRHVEPPRLLSQLKGDLDWIVMKALEKDRTRRYETANGLAMDIRRHLSNEPVMARPPSRWYRLQKLAQRNRIAFASGTAVAAALLVGTTTSTWLFLQERDARHRAVAAEREQTLLRQEAETARASESELRLEAEMREKITQTALLLTQESFEEADKLLAEIPLAKPTIEGAAVLRTLGDWHAVNGHWRQAAERFATLLKVDRLDSWDQVTLDYLELGPALIELGDLQGYERFRQEGIARFAGTAYPVADRIIKINLLLPADEAMIKSLLPQVEVAEKTFAVVEEGASPDVFQAAWRSVSLALFEYRRADYPKAANWCRRCLAYSEHNAPRSATAHVILAMSSWQMGQKSEAAAELSQGREMIDAKFKNPLDRGSGVQGFWFDWVFAKILLREAKGLINAGV
jgi:eukaryotic-like serine/threonine-protein kinase